MEIWTIGHSTRSLPDFVALLEENDVEQVVDIRTMPRSRRNPDYNIETLSAALAPFGIESRHLPALGGLRGRRKDLADSRNLLWRNDSFRNYADYALTPAFRAGLDELRRLAVERRSAMMCAEAVWWRCHRRIVADHLIAGGHAVFHIMDKGKVEPARLTSGAIVAPDGTVTYPATAPG